MKNEPRKTWYSAGFVVFLMITLFSGCNNGIGPGPTPLSTPSSVPVAGVVSSQPEVIPFSLERQDSGLIEKKAVVYFLFDNSSSVKNCCLQGAKDTIELVEFMVDSISTQYFNHRESDFDLSVGVGKFCSDVESVSEICAIGDFPGACKKQFRNGMEKLKEELNRGGTNIEQALDFAKQEITDYTEEHGGQDSFTKIIVIITDGDERVEQKKLYEKINREDQGDYKILYGLYPGANSSSGHEDAELILKCTVLPLDIYEWPNVIFEQLRISENLGWVDSEPVTVTLDNCLINRFYASTTQHSSDFLMMESGGKQFYDKDTLPFGDAGNSGDYRISSSGSLGLYWIKSYKPRLDSNLTIYPIVLQKDMNDEIKVNFGIEMPGEDIAIYSINNCYTPFIPSALKEPTISNSEGRLVYGWTWVPQNDFCMTHHGGEFFLNQYGESDPLWSRSLDFSVTYKPGIYSGGEISAAYQNGEQIAGPYDLFTIDLSVFEPSLSNPTIYLMNGQNTVASPITVSVPSPERTENQMQCPSAQSFQEKMLTLVRFQDVLPVAAGSIPKNLTGFEKMKQPNCSTKYSIKIYRYILESTDNEGCGFSQIAFIWDNKMEAGIIPTAIRCDIDLKNQVVSNCVEDANLLTFQQ
jgi:hypothetical protein